MEKRKTIRFDAPDTAPDDSERDNALISTLEGEIVPRLLMLYKSFGPGKCCSATAADTIDAGDVEELARLLLAHGHETALEFVEVVRQRGIAYESICTDLLVPAAHCLAERWDRNDLSYPQLKLGLDALQSVVVGIRGATKRNRGVAHADASLEMSAAAKRCR